MDTKQIHVYKDFILKVVSVTNKYYIGFDILTEKPIQVEKGICFVVPGESIFNLLRSEESRIRLVMQL